MRRLTHFPRSRILGLPSTIAALAVSAISQNTAITREGFDKAWRDAFAASRNRAVQITVETEVTNDGNIISTDKSTRQFLSPDRTRSLTIIWSGARSWNEETIEIGENGFSKKDGGKWLQHRVTEGARKLEVPSNILPANSSDDERLTCFVSYSMLDGYRVSVFSAERKDEHPGNAFDGVERDSIWISADGLLLKTESTIAEKIESNVHTKRTVSIWSYDRFGFEIEAPTTNR